MPTAPTDPVIDLALVLALREDLREGLLRLSPAARARLPWRPELRLRADQHIPTWMWRTCGLTAGRGWGKSRSAATHINEAVEADGGGHVALLAQTEKRADEIQVQALIDYSRPDFRPVRETRTKTRPFDLQWPNGAVATIFTPGAPDGPRGGNFTMTWASELVAWPARTARDAWSNVTTATRVGRAQIIWDSTAKGRNDLLQALYDEHARDPRKHVVIGGTMFDNPIFPDAYLREEYLKYSGVRRREELFGEHFAQAAGALWEQAWFDAHRVDAAPELVRGMVAADPSFTNTETSDEFGIHVAGADASGHVYSLADLSGKRRPEESFDLVVAHADPRRGKLGGRVVLERNQAGDFAVTILRSRAKNVGLEVRSIEKDAPWPPEAPLTIFVREYHTQQTKDTRAVGPAAETQSGRVHLVGEFPDLERECTTWVPGTRKSPNRLDAFAYVVGELRGLRLEPRADGAEAIRAAAEAQKQLTAAVPGRASGLGIAGGARRGRFL